MTAKYFVTICALLGISNLNSAEAAKVASQLEMESLKDLGSAFDNAFAFLEEAEQAGPPHANLLQLKREYVNLQVSSGAQSESESDSSSDSDSDEETHVLLRDDVDRTMDCTSNSKDTGLAFNTIMDEYTGADNDDFMKRIIDDFGIKQETSLANPGGIVLTKFNAEPASRRFVEAALHIDGQKLDKFMAT